jgi:hypothetical protein
MKKNYVLSKILVLAVLLLAGVSTMAAPLKLVCLKTNATSLSISVSLNQLSFEEVLLGEYRYSERYGGAFPTLNEFSGLATGKLSSSAEGIEGVFDFIAYGVSSRLIIHQSIGQVIIGREISNYLNCSFTQ